jgi:hypothetical protein
MLWVLSKREIESSVSCSNPEFWMGRHVSNALAAIVDLPIVAEIFQVLLRRAE